MHGCEAVKAWNRDTTYWDKKLVSYVKESATEAGISHMRIHSGAGHDAQFASYMIPTTMMFVQSKHALSHCEKEYASPEHCTEGATVMLNAVAQGGSGLISGPANNNAPGGFGCPELFCA